jgi:LysR family hydrogen peroxide-inducible transcriptional activator
LKVTLQELKYFLAVAKHRHFARAAQSCFVSQPSLSTAIQKLEHSLGGLLFERDRHDIRLTALGAFVLPRAQTILAEAEDLRQAAKVYQDPYYGQFRLGFIHSIGPYLYPSLIKQLHRRAPQLSVVIQEGYTHELRDKLHSGDVDMVVAAAPFSAPGVLTCSLYEEAFVALMPREHPLAAKDQVSAQDLQQTSLILLGQGHCLRDQVLSLCPACMPGQIGEANLYEGSSVEAVRYMVLSGMGVSVLPLSAVALPRGKERRLVTRPIKQRGAKREVVLAWRQSFTRPALVDLVRACVTKSDLQGVRWR